MNLQLKVEKLLMLGMSLTQVQEIIYSGEYCQNAVDYAIDAGLVGINLLIYLRPGEDNFETLQLIRKGIEEDMDVNPLVHLLYKDAPIQLVRLVNDALVQGIDDEFIEEMVETTFEEALEIYSEGLEYSK